MCESRDKGSVVSVRYQHSEFAYMGLDFSLGGTGWDGWVNWESYVEHALRILVMCDSEFQVH
jgi:hypothetical protein